MILVMAVLVYTLLFTPLGNSILKPVIEDRINQDSPFKVQLSEFVLDMSHLKVLVKLDDDNTVVAKGEYSLFSQDFDIDYKIGFTKLSNLNNLAKRKLSGKFISDGNVKGNLDLFKVKGKSDLALSQTDYAIIIKDMQLDKAAVKLFDARIQELLSMVGEKPYAKGKIDLHVQLNDLNPDAMKGSVLLSIKEASLDAETLKKELGLNLSKTALKGEFRADLKGMEIDYLAKLNSELARINSKGKIHTGDTTVNSSYRVDIKELALFKSITNAPLRGPFFTEGELSGSAQDYEVKGKSNIAASTTNYRLSLSNMKPSKLILHMQNAKLEKLLYMMGEQPYAKAQLNADIELNDLEPKTLDGEANIRLSRGEINQKVMLKTFKLSLPKTSFKLNAKSLIKPENIDYNFSFISNLAKVSSQGDVHPQTLRTKTKYTIDIKELALLKPLTSAPLRGPLHSSGDISGDRQELIIKGSSNLAKSKTGYALVLKELKPKSAKLDMHSAELSKLLYLIGEPSYAEGKLDANVNLNAISRLDGKIEVRISKGLAHKRVVKKVFDIDLPYTKFELDSHADIQNDMLTAETALTSNLATLKMKKTELDIKSASLKSDYDIYIPFLQRLEPLLERKLYGEVRANGEITKEKQLTITAHSKIFQGQLNAKIIDEKIRADFKDLHALDILKMLGYPEIMDAPVNGNLVYNTKTQKGKLDARFDKAILTRSKMTDLINGLTRTDLRKERFNQGSLISLIDKEIIRSDLKMQSKQVNLYSKKFIINSKKQIIDARFALKVKKHPGDVIVKGDINAPKVRLDAKSMITPEIEEKVGKELNRFLKKLF